VEKLNSTPDKLATWPEALEAAAAKAPFEPIILQRPLLLFQGATGLHPGEAMAPDPDFLVHLLEGSGHQEQVRKAAGKQFKNLKNFLRGSHMPTPTTWRLLLRVLKIDDATLSALAHGREDGPLLPVYVAMFQTLEITFLSNFRSTVHGKVHCPNCSADMLDDSTAWWRDKNLHVPPAAAKFVDRLLAAMLGAVLLNEVLGRWLGWTSLAVNDAVELAFPRVHPIGNWMAMVRTHRKLQHDWQLTAMDEFGAKEPEREGRLRKWRYGQGLLPMDKALAMIAPVSEAPRLKHALLVARTLSLAIDLVQATADGVRPPSRTAAQGLILARIRQLHLHVRMADVVTGGKAPVARSQ